MDAGKKQRRGRRSFSDEFKAGAVRLVLDEGKTISQVARDLDLLRSSVELWVKRARADRDGGKSGPHQRRARRVGAGGWQSTRAVEDERLSVKD